MQMYFLKIFRELHMDQDFYSIWYFCWSFNENIQGITKYSKFKVILLDQ